MISEGLNNLILVTKEGFKGFSFVNSSQLTRDSQMLASRIEFQIRDFKTKQIQIL